MIKLIVLNTMKLRKIDDKNELTLFNFKNFFNLISNDLKEVK